MQDEERQPRFFVDRGVQVRRAAAVDAWSRGAPTFNERIARACQNIHEWISTIGARARVKAGTISSISDRYPICGGDGKETGYRDV